ncbi:glycosyltransferase [Bdellovibrionota bacterium FG-2]
MAQIMNREFEISLILPAYCEEENLRLLLPRLQRVMGNLAVPYEILVIDTQKPLDRTQDACELFNVGYIQRTEGNCFGDAVRTGIREARGKFLLFMDADGSHTPEFIPSLFEHRNSHDVVIASRYIEGGSTENTLLLILMSRFLNVVYSLVLNLKCKDVSNSFKIYRAELLKNLHLSCNNFDIVEEILFKMSRLNSNLRIKEVPFTFKKRMFGETKRNLLVFMLTYLWTIVKLRMSL